MRLVRLVAAATLLSVTTSYADAQQTEPPRDPIADAISAIEAGREAMRRSEEGATREAFAELVRDTLDEFRLHPDRLSDDQLLSMEYLPYALRYGDREAMVDELRERMERDSPEAGACALLYTTMSTEHLMYDESASVEIAELWRAFMRRPDSVRAMDHESVFFTHMMFSYAMYEMPPVVGALAVVREDLADFASELVVQPTAHSAAWSPYVVELANASGLARERVDLLRDRALGNIRRLGTLVGDNEDDRSLLESALERFEHLETKRGIIGATMPAMEILWTTDERADALDAYRGRVVVLDFWATWCRPCIASFPDLRALRERYDEDDVAILGVTSLQGRHYPHPGAAPIDTTDDPEREFALMRTFIDEHTITWHTVFTREPVINPAYAVEGVPHLVIIDREGVVRHNALHPSDGDIAAKIDALLEAREQD